MEREEWLASLKTGDRVAINTSMVGYRILTVDHRTPTGRIILTTGAQFDKNGKEIGSRWNALEEVTPEILADIKHRELASQVNLMLTKLNINTLRLMSTEALEEIANVLKKHMEEKQEAK